MTVEAFRAPGIAPLYALFDEHLPGSTADTVGTTFPDSSALQASPDSFYVRIERVGSFSDQFEGEFTLDIEVFSASYSTAESLAFDIEALLLRYPHRVKVGERYVVLDRVEQNQGPFEAPWEDDSVHRLLATYVLTARRALS